MTKPNLIILGSDPARTGLDLTSAATFTGNECEVAGDSRYSAEDIKRELRRLISERIPTPLLDYPAPLNITPINRQRLGPADLGRASDPEAQARAEWTDDLERSLAECRRAVDPANATTPEHRARLEAARRSPAEALDRARKVIVTQALRPHPILRTPNTFLSRLPF